MTMTNAHDELSHDADMAETSDVPEAKLSPPARLAVLSGVALIAWLPVGALCYACSQVMG